MFKPAVVSIAVFAVIFAPVASGQYCGLDQCVGPCTAQNLIVDGDFGDGCPNWEFAGAAYRATDGDICYGQEAYARLAVNSAGFVSQRINNVPAAARYALSYVVQLNGTNGTRNAELWGNISDANTGQILAYVVYEPGWSDMFCQQRSIDLGPRPDFANRDLRVNFHTTGYSWGNPGVYKVTYVALWQYYV
jgi:hypothetical protein